MKCETWSYGVNSCKILNQRSCTVDLRSNTLFRFIGFYTVYRKINSATHFSVKLFACIELMFSLSIDNYCACGKLNSGNDVKQHSWNVKLQNLQYVSDNTCWIRKRSCQPRWLHVSNIYVTLFYIVHRFPPSYDHKLTSWSAEFA